MTAKRSGPTSRRRAGDEPVWIYGRHAVAAAMNNPARHQHKLLATKNALDWLKDSGRTIPIEPVKPDVIDRTLPDGAVHQGLAVLMSPLPSPSLSDLIENAAGRPLVILDQVTDPQNIGAIFRLSAAFGVGGIIAQDRRTPPLAGALAKAAVGAVDTVPFAAVVNIARSISTLKDAGYEVAGLAGEADRSLPDFAPQGPVALVLGAEGKGLRALVQESCDTLLSIPIEPAVESLNVATAAAVSLYAISQSRTPPSS